jgi:uncharacterized protein
MTKTSRDSFPDVLRGFALLGIALVNIPYLSLDTINAAEGTDLTQPSNAAAAFIVMSLFQAKFYLLFSFLFGYSAHYVLKDDKSNRRRWVARSVGLLILGIIHFTFLFHGDILFLYGLFGLILTALYFRSEKVIRGWTKGIYITISVLFAVLSLLTYVGEIALSAQGKSLPDETFTSRLDGALESGSFLETIGPRLELWLFAAPNGFLLQGPLVFAAFLVGVLVARKNGLVTPNPVLMKKLLVWGLAIGLPLQLLAAYVFIANSTGPDSLGLYLVSLSLNFLTAPLLSAAYVVLLWKVSTKSKLSLMAAAGRMSLTVYLSQSVVFSTLFSAWGFGLFAKLGVLEVTLIAAITWLGLAAASAVYFKFKSKGPMESLLSGFSKLFERKL